jgi:hypothetical protein
MSSLVRVTRWAKPSETDLQPLHRTPDPVGRMVAALIRTNSLSRGVSSQSVSINVCRSAISPWHDRCVANGERNSLPRRLVPPAGLAQHETRSPSLMCAWERS